MWIENDVMLMIMMMISEWRNRVFRCMDGDDRMFI